MKCKEIIELLEKEFPVKYAVPGDRTGFLVGDREKEVRCIFIAVDADDETVGEAAAAGADMLLTHHPMIYAPLASVTTDSFQGRRVIKMIENGLCYMATHTNYDSCRMGTLAAERMGLTQCEVLEETADGFGIGAVGLLPEETTLLECARDVKEKFSIPAVRFFGDGCRKVRKVAICPGSGRSVIAACHRLGAEALITGDIDHHTGIDQRDDHLPIIDAGHYGIEHIYIEDMRAFFAEKCPGLRIVTAKIKHPFETV